MAAKKIDIANYCAGQRKTEKLSLLGLGNVAAAILCFWCYFGPIGRDSYQEIGWAIADQTAEYVDQEADSRNSVRLNIDMGEAMSGTPATSVRLHEFMLAIAFFNLVCALSMRSTVIRKREIAAVIEHFEGRLDNPGTPQDNSEVS